MVIEIDIDGTITQAPEFFKHLTNAFRRDGHKIIVATTRVDDQESRDYTTKQLRELGIVYDELVLSPRFEDLDKRRFPAGLGPTHRLYLSKLFAAEDHGVDVLFDDCGITVEVFRKHLPRVQVFQVLDHMVYRIERSMVPPVD